MTFIEKTLHLSKRRHIYRKDTTFIEKTPHFRGISGIYQGYIPLSLIPLGAPMVRERGIPERINGNSLGVMVGPGPLGDAIVLLLLLFPRRPLLSSSGGIG